MSITGTGHKADHVTGSRSFKSRLQAGSSKTGVTISTNPSRPHAPEGGVALELLIGETIGNRFEVRSWKQYRGTVGELQVGRERKEGS